MNICMYLHILYMYFDNFFIKVNIIKISQIFKIINKKVKYI